MAVHGAEDEVAAKQSRSIEEHADSAAERSDLRKEAQTRVNYAIKSFQVFLLRCSQGTKSIDP